MKTIGVLGGLGPQATMDFETRLHRAAQDVIPPSFNGGYPPTVVWYCRHPPFLVEPDGRPLLPLRADPRLFDAARRLGGLVDFLVIPSNGPHLFAEEIAAAAGVPILSMIETTLEHVRRLGWTRIGVVGLGEPLVYTTPLGKLGLACEIAAPGLRAPLDVAIFRCMEGRVDDAGRDAARAAVAAVRERGVDGVVLGCTEIPLLLGDDATAPDLVNPAQLLAEAAVRAALA